MMSINLREWACDADPTSDPVRKLWGLILLIALKDNARRVDYVPSRGERALTYEIEGIEYAMVPPPTEQAKQIEKIMRDALFPGPTSQGAFSVDVGARTAIVTGSTNRATGTVNLLLVPDSTIAAEAKAVLDALLLTESSTWDA